MEPVLQVTSLEKRFEHQRAVNGISFSVSAGEVLGIVGPNGAGKSTTIKCILGLLQADAGSVRLFGGTIADTSVRQKLGYMPETPSFYNHLTGSELLDMVGELFGISKKERRHRTETLLSQVGLAEAAHKRLGEYSKGMLQRICLAQALINKPSLLFLDEPLDGLDPIGRIRMKELLLDIKSTGTAIVLNSHILSDVHVLSDRIAIMDRGTILKLEPVETLIPKGKTLEDVFLQVVDAV